MANGKLSFDAGSALLIGILSWAMATILETTDIFYMIPNLDVIGLFLGVFIGGLRENLPVLSK